MYNHAVSWLVAHRGYSTEQGFIVKPKPRRDWWPAIDYALAIGPMTANLAFLGWDIWRWRHGLPVALPWFTYGAIVLIYYTDKFFDRRKVRRAVELVAKFPSPAEMLADALSHGRCGTCHNVIKVERAGNRVTWGCACSRITMVMGGLENNK